MISEVVYDPSGEEPDGEWVEFCNCGERVIDLSSYKFGDEETIGGAEGMFSFPPNTTLSPGEAIVVASYATTFQANYGLAPDFEIRESDPSVPNLVKYTAWASGTIRLDNTGDELLVLDEKNAVVDAISYGNSTFFFDPPVERVAEAHSLERFPANQDSDLATDWIDQPVPNPGSVTLGLVTLTPGDTSQPTITPTDSPIPTASASVMPSSTSTVTPSQTLPASQTHTPTASPTPGLTVTPTATLTAEHTPSQTLTQTSSSTPSQTPTRTRTSTSTATPTSTASSTPTYTATSTSSSTPTSTKTPTPQPTPLEARLLISEVLYDPTGSEPAAEWFEIYNAGGSYTYLFGLKIGDEETPGGSEGMMQFPEGTGINSGEVIVVANRGDDFQSVHGFLPTYELVETLGEVPNLVKYNAWANGSVYLNNDGDELLLLGPDDSILDSVSWGSSNWAFDPAVGDVSEGHSIERNPAFQDSDRADDWVDQKEPQPGTVDPASQTPTPTSTDPVTSTSTPVPTPSGTATQSPTPQDTGLLISEVMYDPASDEPQNEWFEIHNAGGESLDLMGYKVGDEETAGQGEGMYHFPDGLLIESGGIILIANQAVSFQGVFGFKPDYELVDSDPDVPDLSKYSAWASGNLVLSNTGDDLLILDGMDQVVDSVSWGSSTWAFDPSAPDVGEGHTLERYPAGVDTDSAVDWIDQEVPNPGEVGAGENWLVRQFLWLWGLFIDGFSP